MIEINLFLFLSNLLSVCCKINQRGINILIIIFKNQTILIQISDSVKNFLNYPCHANLADRIFFRDLIITNKILLKLKVKHLNTSSK